MVDKTQKAESTRRRVLKALGISGLAAGGVAASTGSAAAQPQNLQIDADNLVLNNNLFSISLQNTNVLNNLNITIEDITVVLQNIDVSICISDVIDVGDVTVILVDIADIQNVLNNNNIDLTALNNINLQVAILDANRRLGGSETVQVVG